jgi:hypothetical protein
MADEVRLPKVGDWVSRTDLQRYYPDTYFEVIEVRILPERTNGGVVVINQAGSSTKYDLLAHITVGEAWLFKEKTKGGFAKWLARSE